MLEERNIYVFFFPDFTKGIFMEYMWIASGFIKTSVGLRILNICFLVSNNMLDAVTCMKTFKYCYRVKNLQNMNHSLGTKNVWITKSWDTCWWIIYKKVLQHHFFTTNLWALLSTFLVVMQQRLTIFLWGSPAFEKPQSQRWTAKLRDGNTATAAGRMAGRRDTLTVATVGENAM